MNHQEDLTPKTEESSPSLPPEAITKIHKKLKPEERLEYLKKKAEERAELQKKITDLTAKRAKKVEEELAKKPKTDGEKALDEAVKGLIRDQAKTKGFEVNGEKK